ncbi:hypothetical protein NDU88_005157 [Pleurodeles waltl]|uniref:Uncharacterized protein n=1 Tax=Pleurodeles waltl TaxID=8319 RepID=A0AAV7WCJ9_PLEWA|nr:hypothetical protein NDU88_005157 [Pleurodeles waltl]
MPEKRAQISTSPLQCSRTFAHGDSPCGSRGRRASPVHSGGSAWDSAARSPLSPSRARAPRQAAWAGTPPSRRRGHLSYGAAPLCSSTAVYLP